MLAGEMIASTIRIGDAIRLDNLICLSDIAFVQLIGVKLTIHSLALFRHWQGSGQFAGAYYQKLTPDNYAERGRDISWKWPGGALTLDVGGISARRRVVSAR